MELNNNFISFEDRFEKLNTKMNSLQDIILRLKVDFDLMTRNQLQADIYSQLIKTTEVEMNSFLDNRPSNCEVINQCTTLTEKSAMKVLRVLSEKGRNDAITLLNKYLNSFDSYLDKGVCRDSYCLENAKRIALTLKKLLDSVEQQTFNDFKTIFTREFEFQLTEGNERRQSALMSALANETRIKLLKELSKGSMYYTQLERKLGLKGGHFHFHLNNLIKVNYIIQDKNGGPYSITTSGLRALKFLFELSKEAIK